MGEDGRNLGIATPQVFLLTEAPGINRTVKSDFDFSAFNWEEYIKSPYFKPILCDHVMNDTFAAIFPSKRKWNINNYLSFSQPTPPPTDPVITWYPTSEKSLLFEKIVTPDTGSGYEGFTDYAVDTDGDYKGDYKGGRFYTTDLRQEVFPDDFVILKEWVDKYNINIKLPSVISRDSDLVPKFSAIQQTDNKEDLWWALESNAFLTEDNTPFWVTIKNAKSAPSSKRESSYIISLGTSSSTNDHKMDLYLSYNKKARLIDYDVLDSTADNPWVDIEFPMETSKLWKEDEDIEVGFMAVGGRLIIFLNKEYFIYTKINNSGGDDSGKLKETKIHKGTIRISGTSRVSTFHVSPMVFAPVGLLALPLPQTIDTSSGSPSGEWHGVGYDGGNTDSVSKLPTPPSVVPQIYGVDAKVFLGPPNGTMASPEGFGYLQRGAVILENTADIMAYQGASEFFVLKMWPHPLEISGVEVERAGCPYFFRLKGQHKPEVEEDGGTSTDITDLVISIDQTDTAPDYFHAKKSATITLYNENGAITELTDVLTKQVGIKITWGWSQAFGTIESAQSFTGVVTSVDRVDEPGMETVTLACEDYMQILKSTLMINSPFYDGMVAFFAIKDLAERAGVKQVVNSWDSDVDYFLPSMFGFTKPVMRFASTDSVFDCMINIMKRFEAFIYFDVDGRLVVEKLPGGLFSAFTGAVISFGSDPISNNPILNNRGVTYNYESTFNNISVLTNDRESRNPIIYALSAPAGADALLYRKTYLYDQGALGGLEEAKAWVAEASFRLFKPILKTEVDTFGGSALSLHPLDFITVDGQEFRALSIKKTFNAEANEYSESFDAEWLGG